MLLSFMRISFGTDGLSEMIRNMIRHEVNLQNKLYDWTVSSRDVTISLTCQCDAIHDVISTLET